MPRQASNHKTNQYCDVVLILNKISSGGFWEGLLNLFRDTTPQLAINYKPGTFLTLMRTSVSLV